MKKPLVTADCLYVCGDSWTHGSELIDPTSEEPNHFAPVHEAYRLSHYWPALVAKNLGVEAIDGSHPGGGNDRILRVAMYDVAKLLKAGRKPFVVIAWSQLHRFELPEGKTGGNFWRSFVSPLAKNNPRVADEVWREWSSDRTDVIKWIQQIINLDNFLKINNVNYLSTTVFKESSWAYDTHTGQDGGYFDPYLSQIKQHVNLTRHALNIPFEWVLKQHENVSYGPGGHPLRRGHEIIAEQIYSQINRKFQFQRHQDQ